MERLSRPVAFSVASVKATDNLSVATPCPQPRRPHALLQGLAKGGASGGVELNRTLGLPRRFCRFSSEAFRSRVAKFATLLAAVPYGAMLRLRIQSLIDLLPRVYFSVMIRRRGVLPRARVRVLWSALPAWRLQLFHACTQKGALFRR